MKRGPLILLVVFVAAMLFHACITPAAQLGDDAFAMGYRLGSTLGAAVHDVGYAAIAMLLYLSWNRRRAERAM